MEQLVARWAHNPKVVGSSPAPATKKGNQKRFPFFVPNFKRKFRNTLIVRLLTGGWSFRQ